MLLITFLDELFGLFRRKIALVLVNVYPQFEDVAVSFWMKLRCINVALVSDHLAWARLRSE